MEKIEIDLNFGQKLLNKIILTQFLFLFLQ